MAFDKKFAFRLEIEGIESAAFRTAGPLTGNIGVVEENEGGSVAPQKEPGKVTYDNIVLTRGVTDNEDLWDWFDLAAQQSEDLAKKDLALVQTDRAGTELRRWDIIDAFPVRFMAGDWDATAEENVVEELELAMESFEKG